MKRQIILTAVVLCLISQVFSQQSIHLPPKDSIATMMNKMGVPGLVIATIENGAINQISSFGTKYDGSEMPVDAVFNTASLTKSITSFLALSLVDNGRLTMDERLSDYWIDPDLVDDDRVHLLTPHIILSHQTGFDNWRWMNEEKKLKFNFEPGTKVAYSGEGYEYLRRALEAKFNTTFDELVREHVFGPLKMMDSYLGWDDRIDVVKYAGEFKNPEEPYEITKADPSAADDLITSAMDLGRFLVALNSRLVEDLDFQFFQPQVDVRPGIKFTHGWIRFDGLPNDEYALFGAGSDSGVSAIMCLMPKSERGIVLLSNGENRGLVVNLVRLALEDAGAEIVGRF